MWKELGMIGYKDRTWCHESTHKHCSATDCKLRLTKEVVEDAKKWWKKDNPPIWTFCGVPECMQRVGVRDVTKQEEESDGDSNPGGDEVLHSDPAVDVAEANGDEHQPADSDSDI